VQHTRVKVREEARGREDLLRRACVQDATVRLRGGEEKRDNKLSKAGATLQKPGSGEKHARVKSKKRVREPSVREKLKRATVVTRAREKKLQLKQENKGETS